MLSLIKLDWFLQFDKGFNGFQLKGGYAELKYPAGTETLSSAQSVTFLPSRNFEAKKWS